MLTQQQIQAARQQLGIQSSAPAATPDRVSEFKKALQTTPTATNTTPLDQVKSQFKAGIDQTTKAVKDMITPDKTNPIVKGVEKGLSAESGIATAISAPLAPLFKPLSDIIGAVGNKIGENPAVQKFATSKAGQATAHVAEDLANAGNVAGTITGIDQAVKAVPKIAGAVKDTFSSPTAVATPDTPAPNTSAIVDNYTKAIKPTVAGKTNLGAQKAYNDNIVSAVKSIVANKDKLSFTTPDGEIETARTPKSPAELAHAIDQTKSGIFEQYDALAQKAGDAGLQIPAKTATDALDNVINNEALQVSHPEAVTYAKSLKLRLSDANKDGSIAVPKTFNPQTVQDIIKNYNSSLDAFYKNPSYDNASKAAIDAGVVHTFRESLGKAIEGLTGEDYAGLKKAYGALSAIEKDVNKRALVIARQSSATGSGGLGDYAQIFSGGDMVHGLMSLNPALFAKGAGQAILTKIFHNLKSPDRAIQDMFKAASTPDTATPTTPQAPQP